MATTWMTRVAMAMQPFPIRGHSHVTAKVPRRQPCIVGQVQCPLSNKVPAKYQSLQIDASHWIPA
eukprot:4056148-Amphidinium_carterae.1